MTKTVSEVFGAFQNADTKSIQALASGQLDTDATLGLVELALPLLHCDAVLELNEEQTAVFQKYATPAKTKG